MFAENRRAIVIVASIAPYDKWVRLTRQRSYYIGEHIVRQPAYAAVGGLTRPHPVTRRVPARSTTRALAPVVPNRKEGASLTDREVRLPLGGCGSIGI